MKVSVFDALGKEIDILVNQYLAPGVYNLEWPAKGSVSNYPSGVYFYKLNAGGFTEVKKMVLLK